MTLHRGTKGEFKNIMQSKQTMSYYNKKLFCFYLREPISIIQIQIC